jgi:hypothetical protein
MKRKTLKITESTLFVYKQGTQSLNCSDTTTDTTSIMTTTTHHTGFFNNEKNIR